MILNCFLITVIFVIVSDQLHFWDNFSPIISGWMTNGMIKKPIPSKIMTCSTWFGMGCTVNQRHTCVRHGDDKDNNNQNKPF